MTAPTITCGCAPQVAAAQAPQPDFRPRWTKKNLAYSFPRPPQGLTPEEFHQVVQAAYDKWCALVPPLAAHLAVPGEHVDIMITLFQSPYGGYSGDSQLPSAGMDTPILVRLNDVYYPGGATGPINVLCLHELGHSLGLFHSAIQSAVMWANSWQTVPQSPDDVQKITALYLGPVPENHLVACPIKGTVAEITIDGVRQYP